jgi:hypothetical protein
VYQKPLDDVSPVKQPRKTPIYPPLKDPPSTYPRQQLPSDARARAGGGDKTEGNSKSTKERRDVGNHCADGDIKTARQEARSAKPSPPASAGAAVNRRIDLTTINPFAAEDARHRVHARIWDDVRHLGIAATIVNHLTESDFELAVDADLARAGAGIGVIGQRLRAKAASR